ncbi:MAG: retroviral-like aspartic protease family protein [Treponema sp.]|jgi:clan AA aspartic protease|nr:retroviral-like aspartic protease family protein [Treponema sp.]
MGTVYAEITLKNGDDVSDARRGRIKEQEVRQVSVMAMVDTGAGTLVIDEATCQQLGLGIKGLRRSSLADNSKTICKMTMPVEVHWKDRNTFCEAMVLPDAVTVLLGAIPLEGMDLMVNPVAGELVGAHGDEPLGMIV